MIRWAQPVYLWLLLVLPLGIVAVFLRERLRRRALARAIDPHLIAQVTPAHSPGLAALKQLLVLAGVGFLLLAAARPKWGEKLQLYKGRGIDVVIALDASKSMLASDVKPTRLGRARAELSALIDGLAGNAVGIVAFAGEAHVMCPLTTDADAARLFLDIIEPATMPVPGTDFGKAIDAALSILNPKEANYKAIVLVTDGEDLGKNTAQAIQRAAETGARIFPVAFATAEGAPIPDHDAQGNLSAYKKDASGQVIMSRMNERELIVMARATHGRFLRVEGFSADRLLAELDAMRKKEIGGGSFAELVERYQAFLLIGFFLLLAGLALSNRRGAWLELPRRHRDTKGTGQTAESAVLQLGILYVLGALVFAPTPAKADVGGLMRQGNGLYGRGRYDEALAKYQMAEVLEPDATAIHYNMAGALYRLGRYPDALRELELVMVDRNKSRRAAAMYNSGNVLFKAGQLDGAIKAFTQALLLNPNDRQAKQNLEFCLLKKEEQKQDSTGQQNQQQQQQQQPKPQAQNQQQMSRDQAERLVQAVENKERDEQKEQRQKGGRRKVDQDW